MKQYFAVGILLLSASPIFAQEKPLFPDVPPGHWAFSAIQRLAKEGILQGYPISEKVKATVPPPATKPLTVQKPLSSENAYNRTPIIKTALGATEFLDATGINVDTVVEKRQVFLRGTVVGEFQKHLAEKVAREHSEGYTVVNELTIIRKFLDGTIMKPSTSRRSGY